MKLKRNILYHNQMYHFNLIWILFFVFIIFVILLINTHLVYSLSEVIPTRGCYDTDATPSNSGFSYLIKGIVYYNGNYYGTDSCTSDGLLKEYYCPTPAGRPDFKKINCSLVFGSSFVCSNGECIKNSGSSCKGNTLSDINDFYNTNCIILPNGQYSCDSCSGDTLKRKECISGFIGKEDYVCQYGCITQSYYGYSFGRCCKNPTDQGCHEAETQSVNPTTQSVNPTSGESCKDSDNGIKPLVYGTVIYTIKSKNYEYDDADYCKDDNTLMEFYCKNVQGVEVPDYKSINCNDVHNGYICKYGRCLNKEALGDVTKSSSKCKYLNPNIQNDFYNPNCVFESNGNAIDCDYCIGDELTKYFCVNGVEKVEIHYCKKGCISKQLGDYVSAACNKVESSTSTPTPTPTSTTTLTAAQKKGCYDTTDGSDLVPGSVYYNGIHENDDYCIDKNKLAKFYCKNNKVNHAIVDCRKYGFRWGCYNGYCAITGKEDLYEWSFVYHRWKNRLDELASWALPQSVKNYFKNLREKFVNATVALLNNKHINNRVVNNILDGDYGGAICSIFYPLSTSNAVSTSSSQSPQSDTSFALLATKQKEKTPDNNIRYLYKIEFLVGSGISTTNMVNFSLVNNDLSYVNLNQRGFSNHRISYFINNMDANYLGNNAVSFYSLDNKKQVCLEFHNSDDLKTEIKTNLMNGNKFCVNYDLING